MTRTTDATSREDTTDGIGVPVEILSQITPAGFALRYLDS